jgi:hypothetical protein
MASQFDLVALLCAALTEGAPFLRNPGTRSYASYFAGHVKTSQCQSRLTHSQNHLQLQGVVEIQTINQRVLADASAISSRTPNHGRTV